jgi:hypothetical protein
MPITPFESTARGDTRPTLSPSIGLGPARQQSAAATEAGAKITAAGLAITRQQIDILNKKQDQDDKISGFNHGVAFSKLAVDIFQEERINLAGSEESLTSRIEERVRNELDKFTDSVPMTEGARAEFNRRAAMSTAKINASAGVQEIADAAVNRSMSFQAALQQLTNQVFSGMSIDNGLIEYDDVIKLIEDPKSGFGVETQKLLKSEATKIAFAAYNGLLEPSTGASRPREVIDSLASGIADNKLTPQQKMQLMAKAKRIEKAQLAGDPSTETNRANGQLSRLETLINVDEEFTGIPDYANFPKVFTDPAKQELHERNLEIVANVTMRILAIGDTTIQDELGSLQELKDRRKEAPDDEIILYDNQIARYIKSMAVYEKGLKKDFVATYNEHNESMRARYEFEFKNNPSGTILEDLAIEMAISRGYPANNARRFTLDYLNTTLASIFAPYKKLNAHSPGALNDVNKTFEMRVKVEALRERYGKNFSRLVTEWKLFGTDQEIPNTFYLAMMHSHNPAVFDYLITASKLTPEQLKGLVRTDLERNNLSAAIFADNELKTYVEQAIQHAPQQDLKEALQAAAYIIHKNLNYPADKVVIESLIKHFITNNNLSTVEFNRFDGTNTLTTRGTLFDGKLSSEEKNTFKYNMTDPRNAPLWGVSKPGSGFVTMNEDLFWISVVTKMVPRPQGDGTYVLTIPTDFGDHILRDAYGNPVSLTRKQLVQDRHEPGSTFEELVQSTEVLSPWFKSISWLTRFGLAVNTGLWNLLMGAGKEVLPIEVQEQLKEFTERMFDAKSYVDSVTKHNVEGTQQNNLIYQLSKKQVPRTHPPGYVDLIPPSSAYLEQLKYEFPEAWAKLPENVKKQFGATKFKRDIVQRTEDVKEIQKEIQKEISIKPKKAFRQKFSPDPILKTFSEDFMGDRDTLHRTPSARKEEIKKEVKKVSEKIIKKNIEARTRVDPLIQKRVKAIEKRKITREAELASIEKTDAAIAEKIKELKEFASSSLTRLSELYGWSKTKAAEVKNIVTNIISLETDPEPLNLEDQIKLNTNKNKLSDNLVTKHRPMPDDEKTANDDQIEYLTLLQLLQSQMHMIFMERKTSGKIINERILNMEDELSKIQGNMTVLEQKWPHLEHAFPDYTNALKNKEKGKDNIWKTFIDELNDWEKQVQDIESKTVIPNVPYIKEQQQAARTVKIISKWRKSFKKNQILKMFPKNKSGNDKLRDTIAEITEAIEALGPNKDLTAVRDTLTTELNTRDSLTKKYEKNKGNPWDDINLPSRSGK